VLYPTGVSILAIWTIQVPTAYLLSRQIGIVGVWIGYPVTFLVMLTAQIAYYRLHWCHRKHQQLT
jgi:Na+-driven multidrug efflux pump